ncbi:MAG: ADP-ribosyltransferase domain-containing protein [Paludibacteraceae bacterium]|nr:ADP-ribosyltransferase domain-containing protein [Paludibacteraceae bacterium]
MENLLVRIAKLLLAESKWVKFNSKSHKQGWKRKKSEGGYEYRYQDNDPNTEKGENGGKSTEDKMTLSLGDVVNHPFYNAKNNFLVIWENPQKISKGKYRIDTSFYGNPQTWEAETQEYEGGPLGFKNKLLIQELYKKAGISIGSTYLSDVKNKPAIYTLKEGTNLDPKTKGEVLLINAPEFLKGFVMDALLGNKNVLGDNYENIEISEDSKIIRTGNRNALLFNEGGINGLSDEVTEIKDFRDTRKYPQLAKLYSNISEKDILSQISKTLKLLDEKTLMYLVRSVFPKPEEDQIANSIIDKLSKRRNSLLNFAKEKAIELVQENVLKRKEKYIVGPGMVKEPAVMSNKERNAIYEYTGVDYQKINKYLRGETTEDSVFSPELKGKSSLLVHALRKLPAFKGTVYRGTELDDPSILTIMTMKPGDLIYMKSFTSSSISKDKAKGFSADVLFEIETTTGRDVSHISEYPTEEEVILSPDTRYEITEISYQDQMINVKLKELLPTEHKKKMPINIRNKREINPEEIRKFLLSNPKLSTKQRERILKLSLEELKKVLVAILSKKNGKSENTDQEEPAGKFMEIFI